jgi:hypothetical protein
LRSIAVAAGNATKISKRRSWQTAESEWTAEKAKDHCGASAGAASAAAGEAAGSGCSAGSTLNTERQSKSSSVAFFGAFAGFACRASASSALFCCSAAARRCRFFFSAAAFAASSSRALAWRIESGTKARGVNFVKGQRVGGVRKRWKNVGEKRCTSMKWCASDLWVAKRSVRTALRKAQEKIRKDGKGAEVFDESELRWKRKRGNIFRISKQDE